MDYSTATSSEAGTLPSLMYIDYHQQQSTISLPPSSSSTSSTSTSPSSPTTLTLNNNTMIHLPSPLKKRTNKIHVSAACINCKKAHLACDVSRPCQRCISTDKADTCRDIQHKKRGRPKMLRDANNNKIRPTPQQKLPLLANQQQSKPAILPPDLLLFSSNTTTANQDMMAIFLSMDLCCARVSDKSFQYLELYPQEFSHRSLYDFLVPGESRESLAKLHRRLLNNASQSLMTTATTTTAAAACNFIRSSCDKFFSTPFEFLLTIANGSLTLKTILKFRRGQQQQQQQQEENESRIGNDGEQDMMCRFYLGGGLGTDLIESIDLTQLYIVCVATPVQQRVAAKVSSSSSVSTFQSILQQQQQQQQQQQVSFDDSGSITTTSLSTPSPKIMTTSSPIHTDQQQQQQQDHDDQQHDEQSTRLLNAVMNDNNNSSTDQLQYPPPTTSTTTTPSSSSSNDRFRYQPKPPAQQFIHPNELYYLQTTSSRMSMEAMAHTAYLSNNKSTQFASSTIGSGPLAAFNQHVNYKK